MDIRPSCTIYINNLSDKIKKEELKRSLFELFSQFGQILDIVALKTMKMRGQAFIVFREISSANVAMRTLNGYSFYDKPMRIQYSKKESEVIARMKGTYVEKTKKKKVEEEVEVTKPKKKKPKPPSAAALAIAASMPQSAPPNGHVEEQMESTSAYDISDEGTHNILFLTNLPEETSDMMLSMLFTQFPGFKEVRLIPGRSDIAFVEYDTDAHATAAKEALNGFKITTTHAMQVTFSKK